LYFTLSCRSNVVLAYTFGTIGRREEALFTTLDMAAAVGATNVKDVRDACAVDSLRALLRSVKERVWIHAPTTALESDIRVETFKSGRAMVDPTNRLVTTTSSQSILVGEDSVAACCKFRTRALIVRLRGSRTTSVGEYAAHAITELVRRRTDAFILSWDIRRVTIERARVVGGAGGRGVIRIDAFLPVLCGIDQEGKISLDPTLPIFFSKAPKVTPALDSS